MKKEGAYWKQCWGITLKKRRCRKRSVVVTSKGFGYCAIHRTDKRPKDGT